MVENEIIEGFLPYGIHPKKGLLYFSRSRQKWIDDIGKVKIGDLLSTPTVPIDNPEKILKNIKDVGVAKIKLTIEFGETQPPLEEEGRIDEFLTFEIPPDDEIDNDGNLINDPSLDELPIPKNLDEAIEILATQENIEFILKCPEDEFLCHTHHGFGTGIRNAWGLWTGSDLAKWFNEKGIYHADDMSSIILTSSYRKALGKEIDLEGQINKYRDFWEENNPDVNKGII